MFRGYNETVEILKYDEEKVYETENWGPVLHAIYSGKIDALTHLLQEYTFNYRKELFLEPDNDPGSNSLADHNKMLPFELIAHR